jgi:hypothetical protein
MSQFVERMLATVTVAALALTAAGCSDAGAATASSRATGPVVYSDQHAGYQAAGRWFRYVATTVTVPPRTLPYLNSGSAFIGLNGRYPAWINVDPGGGADSVGYAATNMGTGPFRLAPRVGDRLAISIYYDQRGHIFFTVTDLTRPATQTVMLYVGRDFTAWFRALPLTYTSAFAGYADSGGLFRFVSTTLTVPLQRVPGEAALVSLGYNGGAAPRPYTSIEVLAGGGAGSISYQASTTSGSFTSGTFTIRPKTGDRLTVSIYYDQHGHEYFTVTDTTRHTTQTVKVTAVFYGTSGYNSAEILAMIKNGVVIPPLTDIQLWKFAGSHVTTYSGKHGTVLGPWATSQYTDTTTQTAAGATVMSASVLSSNGQNFAAWLRHR